MKWTAKHLVVLLGSIAACSDSGTASSLDPGANPSGDPSAITDGAKGTSPGAGTNPGAGNGPSTGPGPLVGCNQTQAIKLAPSGLPLLESNPGAPIALFIDYDGGTYNGGAAYGGYNRNGSAATFDAEEQADIVASFMHLSHYYAMFDVNVTTDDAVRQASKGWGWILVTEDASGGLGSLSTRAIGQPKEAMSYCGASSARIEDSDKSRRIAHELGHNFMLEHSGVWDAGTFYKWEDWPAWDKVYGPIMGGGGLGQRNGWAFGHHEADPNTLQDEMEIIRQRVIAVGGSATGWRKDDFSADVPSALCSDPNGSVYTWGILERPDDVDLFDLVWSGGNLVLEGSARDVSTAVIVVDVLKAGAVVGGLGTTPNLAAGTYQLRVKSKGGYAEIGSYEVRARH